MSLFGVKKADLREENRDILRFQLLFVEFGFGPSPYSYEISAVLQLYANNRF